MVMSCCVLGCTNRSENKGEDGFLLSFHRFPTDPTKRQKWILATKRENFNPGPHIVICSAHFKPEDYYPTYASGLRKLRENVVPSVFDFPLHRQKAKKVKKRTKLPAKRKRAAPKTIVPATETSESSISGLNIEKTIKNEPLEVENTPTGSLERMLREYDVGTQAVGKEVRSSQRKNRKNSSNPESTFIPSHSSTELPEDEYAEEQRASKSIKMEPMIILSSPCTELPFESENMNVPSAVSSFETQPVIISARSCNELPPESGNMNVQSTSMSSFSIKTEPDSPVPNTEELPPEVENMNVQSISSSLEERIGSTADVEFFTSSKKRKAYVQDYQVSDMDCPQEAIEFFELATAKLSEKEIKEKSYLQAVNRLKAKVNILENLLQECKTKCKSKDANCPLQDRAIFEKWKDAIPSPVRELEMADRVCELHFEDRYVMRHHQQKLSDGAVFSLERGRPDLTPDAVPTIFPSAAFRAKTQENEELIVPEISTAKEESEESNLVPPTPTDDMTSVTIKVELNDNFAAIVENALVIEVPNKSWGASIITEDSYTYVIWTKWKNFAPERRVIVLRDMSVVVFLKHRDISHEYAKIESMDDIPSLLQRVEDYVLCGGIADDIMEDCLCYLELSNFNRGRRPIYCKNCQVARRKALDHDRLQTPSEKKITRNKQLYVRTRRAERSNSRLKVKVKKLQDRLKSHKKRKYDEEESDESVDDDLDDDDWELEDFAEVSDEEIAIASGAKT